VNLTIHKWDKAPYCFLDTKNGEPLPDWLATGPYPDGSPGVLDEELRYLAADVEHTDRFARGQDCHQYQLWESNNGNLFFPIGHLDNVKNVLDSLNTSYEVTGGRDTDQQVDYGEWTGHDLRPYQREAVDKFLQNKRGIVSLPTGCGKTELGLRIAYELQKPFIVLADSKDVAKEWMDRIPEALGVEPAKVYGGDRETGDVQVALYQSCFDVEKNEDGRNSYEVRDDVYLDHDLAIMDECHNVAPRAFSTVAMDVSAPYRLGLSATPERPDGHTPKVVGGTGSILVQKTPEEMIEKGYLAEPQWEILNPLNNKRYYREWRDEYEGEIVENGGRNNMIANAASTLVGKGKSPVLVSVERIPHGERLESLMEPMFGDDVRFIHADSNDREEVIEAFRSGELPVLITTLLKEGFDCPELLGFINAGGMKSEISTIQSVGRALRRGSGENPVLVDFADEGRWVGDHFEIRMRHYRKFFGDNYGP